MDNTYIVSVFEDVLSGRRRSFPRYIWEDETNCIYALRYLIEEKLKWSREDVCAGFGYTTFEYYKLCGMLNMSYQGSPFKALNSAYPGEYKQWELGSVPNNFWNEENSIRALKWLIEEKLKWSEEEVRRYLTQKVLRDNRIFGVVGRCFKGDMFAAVNAAYPGVYKAEDFNPKHRVRTRSHQHATA